MGFYLLPIHTYPALREGLSPALAKRLTGKSTFTFPALDEELATELEGLVARAFDVYMADAAQRLGGVGGPRHRGRYVAVPTLSDWAALRAVTPDLGAVPTDTLRGVVARCPASSGTLGSHHHVVEVRPATPAHRLLSDGGGVECACDPEAHHSQGRLRANSAGRH